jgi:hypothetical protein
LKQAGMKDQVFCQDDEIDLLIVGGIANLHVSDLYATVSNGVILW